MRLPRLALVLALFLAGLPASGLTIAPQQVARSWNSLANDATALSLGVPSRGIVEVSAAALAAAGWPVPSLDPATIRVWRRGQEVPAEVLTAGGQVSTVRFVADANDSVFSTEARYWLSYGSGPGQRAPVAASARVPAVWERDVLYQPAFTTVRGDSWFAAELRPGGTPLALSLVLPEDVPAGRVVEIALQSLIRRAAHRLELRDAAGVVATGEWSDGPGQEPTLLKLPLTRALPAGTAALTLAVTTGGTDAILVDALQILDLQTPLPTFTPTLQKHTPRDLRQGPEPGSAGGSYLVITHASLRPALDPLIAQKQTLGERVAVVDAQWAYDAWSYGERDPEAIRALVATAAAQWRPAPRAVLLVGAGTTRMRGGDSRAPTPGLLVSDAPIADPLIPPYLVRGIDPSGEIACDTCYTRLDAADVRDDLLPNLPIGRFPARTLEEARTLVTKTVGHATAPPGGSWRNRVLMLADNDVQVSGEADPAGPFSTVLAEAAALLPQPLQVNQFVFAPQRDAPTGTFSSTAELRCRLFRMWDGGSPRDPACPPLAEGAATGAALLLYVGHGSPWQWAATTPAASTPYLFYLYDADGRRNGARLPIVLSMTCYSGNWANPVLQSLDERLLLWPNGGSVASFAAVGSGVNTAHARLLSGLLPVLSASQGPRSLGAAHLAALGKLDATARDLAYSFHILGDPDVALPAPLRPVTYLPLVDR